MLNKTTIIIGLLILIVLGGCNRDEDIANYCINKTNTNDVNNCRLYLCLVTNEYTMMAKRTLIDYCSANLDGNISDIQ